MSDLKSLQWRLVRFLREIFFKNPNRTQMARVVLTVVVSICGSVCGCECVCVGVCICGNVYVRKCVEVWECDSVGVCMCGFGTCVCVGGVPMWECTLWECVYVNVYVWERACVGGAYV